MAFLQLGGEGGQKPTYFEVYAADKLVPSLKAALIYSLSVRGRSGLLSPICVHVSSSWAAVACADGVLLLQVAGQTRSWVLRLLQYEDEVFALVSLLLERHSLANLHATFAESLYGLKRQPVQQQQSQQHHTSSSNAALVAAGVQQAPGEPVLLLNKQQQRQALLCQASPLHQHTSLLQSICCSPLHICTVKCCSLLISAAAMVHPRLANVTLLF